MCESGSLVAHWPVEYGGAGASDVITAIFREEAIKAHPRVSHGDCGVDLVAPLLMRYGSDAQKRRFLEPIRNETEIWTQGFSEPNAGSDLASLKTRAVKDGDDWVMNGMKTWSTYAPVADWIFLLARTDPQASRHRGISCFLVEVASPGIEIRPIRDIAGTVEFAEIFFTDVRVPAENMLGGENEGWGVAVMTLAHERVIESYEDIGELGFMFDRLLDGLRERVRSEGSASVGELVRDRVAELWCRFQAVRLVQYRCVLALEGSDTPPSESEIVKLGWSEVAQHVARLGLEVFASSPGGAPEYETGAAFWEWEYLNSRSLTIYAGTSEIIRSVVAERVLGLPRSR
jgi:alkylation response protein AidB-like acyl-CoA dehydrogenase